MTRANMFASSLNLMALVVALLAGGAQAQAPATDGDPPVRVARLSYAGGQVSFSPAGNDEWVQAVVNRPVVTGDRLWADNDSRAELADRQQHVVARRSNERDGVEPRRSHRAGPGA